MLKNKIEWMLESKNAFSPFQTDLAFKDNQMAIVVFLYLKSAYDYVYPYALYEDLNNLNIPIEINNVILKMMQDIHLFTRKNDGSFFGPIKTSADSQSAIKRLQRTHIATDTDFVTGQIRELIQKTNNLENREILLGWIPSHAGILGNEEADKLANIVEYSDTSSENEYSDDVNHNLSESPVAHQEANNSQFEADPAKETFEPRLVNRDDNTDNESEADSPDTTFKPPATVEEDSNDSEEVGDNEFDSFQDNILKATKGTKRSTEKKRSFINGCVNVVPVKRKRTQHDDSRRALTYQYFLAKNDVQLRVCLQFFQATLNTCEVCMNPGIRQRWNKWKNFDLIFNRYLQCPRIIVDHNHKNFICQQKYKNIPEDKRTDNDRNVYLNHQKEKDEAKRLFLSDQSLCLEDNTLVVSFDLQKVLGTPHGQNMLYGFSRKYAVYNFTIYESKTKNAFCYVWEEKDGKRGVNEICTHLHNYLLKIDEEKKYRKVLFYCDNCPGQNKNKILLTMLLHFVRVSQSIEEVIITYLVAGHTYMPVDSVHAVIEKYVSKLNVQAPSEWITLLRNARHTGRNSLSALQRGTAPRSQAGKHTGLGFPHEKNWEDIKKMPEHPTLLKDFKKSK
ncbi:hypothetical protein HUJ04_011211 [Dendroctonus ponderosae]|nr:hypothetical protein HUJ04_011211 [Dendroctonus ponderosae]